MNKSIKKLNLTNKFAPIVASGVLFLTGCGITETNSVKKDIDVEIPAVTMENDVTTTSVSTTSTLTTASTACTTTAMVDTEKNNTTENSSLKTTATNIKTTTVPVTTVVTTTTAKAIKHPGESGYNEFNNHLADIMGEYNTYSYVDTFAEYEVVEGDKISDLAEKFNTTPADIMEINNLENDNIKSGDILKYRVKDEYINCRSCIDVVGVAVANGINPEEVLKLNDIPEYNTTLGKDAAIKLHRYVGNETRYQTGVGVVNCIYNNRILGEDVERATGFMGSSQMYLVKNSSLSGVSFATSYRFDGGDGILDSKMICSNPKRLEVIDGIPVAFLRTETDLEELAADYGIDLDNFTRLQWESVNMLNYPIHITENGEQFITMDGRIIPGYDLISCITNDNNEEIETPKKLYK